MRHCVWPGPLLVLASLFVATGEAAAATVCEPVARHALYAHVESRLQGDVAAQIRREICQDSELQAMSADDIEASYASFAIGGGARGVIDKDAVCASPEADYGASVARFLEGRVLDPATVALARDCLHPTRPTIRVRESTRGFFHIVARWAQTEETADGPASLDFLLIGASCKNKNVFTRTNPHGRPTVSTDEVTNMQYTDAGLKKVRRFVHDLAPASRVELHCEFVDDENGVNDSGVLLHRTRGAPAEILVGGVTGETLKTRIYRRAGTGGCRELFSHTPRGLLKEFCVPGSAERIGAVTAAGGHPLGLRSDPPVLDDRQWRALANQLPPGACYRFARAEVTGHPNSGSFWLVFPNPKDSNSRDLLCEELTVE